MEYDLWFRGGTVVDPSRDLEQKGDVFVRGEKIAAPPAGGTPEAERVVDARGCLVMPGLIDFHAHLFARGSELGVSADSSCLPQGVTTAVDAGTAGFANYEDFVQSAVLGSQVRIFSFLHVSPTGIVTRRYHENMDPKHFDFTRVNQLFEKYRGQLIGLKVRQSKELVGELGLLPLRETLNMAEKLLCPVTVHATNPPSSAEELASLLRPGDIFCHVFHGKGSTIIGQDGKVLPGIKDARVRGVIFDAANGRNHFAFSTARAALAEGFRPDVISTDLSSLTLYGDWVFGLPAVMSKYISLGIPIREVVAACTSTPARLLGLSGTLGTLVPGAKADVAVFKVVSKEKAYVDSLGETWVGSELLVPQLTVLAGGIVYRQIDF